MARKTQGTGDRGQGSGDRDQESAEPTTSPAMELDVDVSPETEAASIANSVGENRILNVLSKSPANAPAAALPARQGDEGRPFCGKHNCLMKAVRSGKDSTNYSCPVPFCDQKEKRARSSVSFPREPSRCPDIRCRGKTVESYLEVDLRRSSTAHLCMVCPACGYDIKVPRPTFNLGVRTYQHDDGDLAAR